MLVLFTFPDEDYFRPHNLTSKHSFKMIRPQATTQRWRAHPFIFFHLNGILIMLYLIKKRRRRRRVSVFFSILFFSPSKFLLCKHEYSCDKELQSCTFGLQELLTVDT